ncbi:DNA polymerase II large subunit [Thermoplasma volcanium]|nr:DNA polymerase II large subunit [Thermoplasma volcanium]
MLSEVLDLESYRKKISDEVRECFDLASQARELGMDVTDKVEIPLASDMAERIEALIGISGIADQIRDLSKKMSREEVSLEMSRRVANIFKDNKKEALDKAIRVGLAILTEGILVAPLEGIADVYIGKNADGSDYVGISYAGPIRGAGGTAQALSVLIGDVVRRELGITRYIPTEEEIERYIEEIESYDRIKHLQYLPTPDEIKLVVKNSPVCIDGEGSEEEEVSGHRDMARVKTNRIRGGMCLVLCEGLVQKARKILKYTSSMHLEEWSFLSSISGKSDDKGSKKSDKFLKDIVAGRPVFSHPSRPGGFRLRYGRSRVSGLAAASLNPATMYIMGKFIAIGSQIKVELPGKAAAVTPCDTIDGPTVLLRNGDHVKINNIEKAKELYDEVVEITDAGEILIAYGDFLENNYNLPTASFTKEWWMQYLPDGLDGNEVDQFRAVELSRQYNIPLHPDFDYYWHDISFEELEYLISAVENGRLSDNSFLIPYSASEVLIKLGVQFKRSGNFLVLNQYYPLLVSLGYDVFEDKIKRVKPYQRKSSVLETVNYLSGITIKPRAPTRVGSRLGRPEKAGDRKMKPMVHSLFPVESYGEARRSILNANKKTDGTYKAEVFFYRCTSCGYESPSPTCPKCGSRSKPIGTKNSEIDLSVILRKAEDRLGIKLDELKEFKGVKKLMSKEKVAEPIEKGILRAIHGISVNKDGTCRFDMSDIPITHFRYKEIGISKEKLSELGYEVKDVNEIFPQDVIIPRKAAKYLFDVSKFIDDLLVRYYGLPPFYSLKSEEDLVGHLVIGLAPHTSGGVVGRIIGFSDVNAFYAHPFFHAAKRRNCDGDEDSVMLLMDGFLNFSARYLPSTTGGLMDAPLVLSVLINPDEIDKEALNVDTLQKYPLIFYEATERHAAPSELEETMMTMKVRIKKTATYRNSSYTFDTSDINKGVLVSSYKTLATMDDKISEQLGLARRIRAVDADDVAARVISTHFLPDMYGNFRRFFSQEFRCTKCNAKYRRIPLSGRCMKCGSDSLTLTIHKGSVIKYLDETLKIEKEYNIPKYLKERIDNLARTIKETFPDEEKPDAAIKITGLDMY